MGYNRCEDSNPTLWLSLILPLSLKLPVTDVFDLMGTITEAAVESWETHNFVENTAAGGAHSPSSDFEKKKKKKAFHNKMAKRQRRFAGQNCVSDWLKLFFMHEDAATRPWFHCFAFCLPPQRHQSPSLQQSPTPQESYSRSCSQSELTPRPFSNCPGMFDGAQSNWTVTIPNRWFAAARY